MVAGTENILFTKQDVEILNGHFPRFGLTTNPALARVSLESAQAAKKWAARMRDAGFIQSANLGLRTKYHILTIQAVRLFRIPGTERLTKLPGPSARQRAFGVLAFCCLGPKLHQKFTNSEFVERFPALDLNGPVDCYYRDTDGPDGAPKRIGYILVDCGRDTQRVIQRLHELISQRLNHEAWRAVLQNERFVISVVTTADAKRRQLEDAIREQQDERYLNRQVAIRVEVREPLRDLITSQELEQNDDETPSA